MQSSIGLRQGLGYFAISARYPRYSARPTALMVEIAFCLMPAVTTDKV